jgi:hypothetical protein
LYNYFSGIAAERSKSGYGEKEAILVRWKRPRVVKQTQYGAKAHMAARTTMYLP